MTVRHPEQKIESLARLGYAPFSSSEIVDSLSGEALSGLGDLQASFVGLATDKHMADGGVYRKRAYSRFELALSEEGTELLLSALPGHSILQSPADNTLNGGVVRTFAPLVETLARSVLLRSLILKDAEFVRRVEPGLFSTPLVVGVHQVRIVASGSQDGLPTPEGIHRDAERYTFQHLIGRHLIKGGEFRAYDADKNLIFEWLQEEPFDSVVFLGTTWHSAAPISAIHPAQKGYRDILLIDFEPATPRDGGV